MINSKEFEKLRRDYESVEGTRETIIQSSRDIIHLSKRIINAVHRDKLDEAASLLKGFEAKKKALQKIQMRCDTNIDLVAMQEYVEAVTFYHFAKTGSLLSFKKLNVDADSYLQGLSDLTGELGRRAVNESIKKNYDNVVTIKTVIEELYAELLKFNLRNGELRKKFDQIKWNLKKVEDIIYELQLKGLLN